jgi:O-antigen/teichoic acid export membrane protein
LLKKHALFGFVFTIAKATVYFVPLLLADVLSSTDFGILEYALAGLGMVINTVINLGVPGAYPYFILRQKELTLKHAFKLHPVILIIPFAINQLLFYGFNLNVNFYFAFNISFIIANQVFYSTQLKSHEKSEFAVIIDSGIYILLLICYVFFKLNVLTVKIEIIGVFVLIYSCFYVFYGLLKFYKVNKRDLFLKYKKIIGFSIHLLISTFLIFLITTSGRILVEMFFGFEQVGVYAFYFRLAAVVVMIHQIVNIAYFKKIYTLNPRTLDNYFFVFYILIFMISIAAYFFLPLVGQRLSTFFADTFQSSKDVYFLLSVQMVMWIATALNSNIIDREGLASKNNTKFIILIICSIGLFLLLKNHMSLSLLTFCHLTIIFLACLIQFYSLSLIKVFFKKSVLSLSLIYLVSVIYYYY